MLLFRHRKKLLTFINQIKYPLTYRINNDQEEILFCLLEGDADMMSTNICEGVVRVLPLTPEREAYDFLPALSPARTY